MQDLVELRELGREIGVFSALGPTVHSADNREAGAHEMHESLELNPRGDVAGC